MKSMTLFLCALGLLLFPAMASATPIKTTAQREPALHVDFNPESNLPVVLFQVYAQLEEEALLRLLPPSERLTRKFYAPETELLFPFRRPLQDSGF
ncbi:MAG TPA: hypothetical protein V6C52_01110 [Coleofasciculaceae cyanobacterium]